MPGTSVAAGLWILVECNIGIVSACLPTMRPLFNTPFAAKVASRFSSTGKSSKGSGRLSDEEQPSSCSTDCEFRQAYPDAYHQPLSTVYKGAGRNETWYSVSSEPASKQDRGSVKVQDVEMVPQGQIAVRHDVLWERNSGCYR